MTRVLRIYSETVPLEDVVRAKTVELLARFRLELVLAVRPWDLSLLPRVAMTLRDAGVPLSIWPMLSDADGRWANARNAATFARFTMETIDLLERTGAPAHDVLVDLEPPFAQARALAALEIKTIGAVRPPPKTRADPAFDEGASVLASLVEELRGRRITSSLAVWPLVALDAPGERGWQGLLGTPVDALAAERVSVMMYTSIVEGWSRGAVLRPHALDLLAAATERATRRWGPRTGISLGCVGVGAFEDEPIYRDPSELAEDVAVVRASGCDDLSLFDLGGVLARGPAEAWLEAFTSGTPRDVVTRPGSRRVALARRFARLATWALARRQR